MRRQYHGKVSFRRQKADNLWMCTISVCIRGICTLSADFYHSPEKDHAKQIRALALLLQAHPEFRKENAKARTSEDSTDGVVIVDHDDSKDSPNYNSKSVQLVLLGSARHQEDLERVEELKRLAAELGVEVFPSYDLLINSIVFIPIVVPTQDQVTFVLNAPYEELLSWLSKSSIGISTMVEEHFGIGVVEFMVGPSLDAVPCWPGQDDPCAILIFSAVLT